MLSITQKEFKKNLIKGLIWVLLLLISFVYLYFNYGERVSLLWWLETIWQRISIWYVRMTWWDYHILEQRINQQARIEDIIQKIKHATCEDPELYNNIYAIYNVINNMDTITYKQKLWDILEQEQFFYQEFQQTCK